jgi:hypothetical protein
VISPHTLKQKKQCTAFERVTGLEKTVSNNNEFAHIWQELHRQREDITQGFERLETKLQHHRDYVDQRFEQVDQRFEQVDQRFDRLEQRFELVIQEMRDLRDWVELIAGRLQNRVGRNIEDVVAGALRLGLSRSDIRPDSVKMRQKIHDPTGLVYKPGKQKEVDMIVQNGELLVFEVKSAPKPDDVDVFAEKVELVRLQNQDKLVQGVFIAVGVDDNIRRECAARDILLIP